MSKYDREEKINYMEKTLEPFKINNVEFCFKKNIKVSGIANITGGGITENIPRIIPKHLAADIDLNSWKFPKAFQWLKEKGKVSNEDMLRIFNCGIGLAVILPVSEVKSLEGLASKYKFKTHRIGKIVKRTQGELTYLN